MRPVCSEKQGQDLRRGLPTIKSQVASVAHQTPCPFMIWLFDPSLLGNSQFLTNTNLRKNNHNYVWTALASLFIHQNQLWCLRGFDKTLGCYRQSFLPFCLDQHSCRHFIFVLIPLRRFGLNKPIYLFIWNKINYTLRVKCKSQILKDYILGNFTKMLSS